MSESFANNQYDIVEGSGSASPGTVRQACAENGPSRVEVKAMSRLHMGFFDLNGNLGRKFGSIGVSLDNPAFVMQVYPSSEFTAEAADTIDKQAADSAIKRAVSVATRIASALKLDKGVHIRLDQVIPEHAGLGSGTQLSLAVGSAISRLYGLESSLEQLAVITQRGARSGIGLGTFARGGVIADGGRGPTTVIPPLIAGVEFPETWRILLIFDHADTGVHGQQEYDAFRTLEKLPQAVAAEVCRHVLMQALPALAEQDLAVFGAAIRELQAQTGDYFAPVQGGRYASKRVAAVLAWLGDQGVICLGQSSWGPTGFAMFASVSEAEVVQQRLNERFRDEPALEFVVCKGHNQGAEIHEFYA